MTGWKRKLGAWGLALAVGNVLIGCANDPSRTDTIDARPAPKGMETVGVCYNGDNTTRKAVSEIAVKACPEGTTKLKVWDHDHLANACPLTKANRVVFLCLQQ